jgi:hypothetical protein
MIEDVRVVGYGEVMRMIEPGCIEDRDEWEPVVRQSVPPHKLAATLAYDDLSDL